MKSIDKDKTFFITVLEKKRNLAISPTALAPHVQNERRRSSLQVPLESSIEIALLRNRINSASSPKNKLWCSIPIQQKHSVSFSDFGLFYENTALYFWINP